MTPFRLRSRALAATLLVVHVACTSIREPSLVYDLPTDGPHAMTVEERPSNIPWSESETTMGNVRVHFFVHHLSAHLHGDAFRERALQESLHDTRVTLGTLSADRKPDSRYDQRIVINSMSGMEVGFVDGSASRVLRVLVGNAYVVILWADSSESGVTLKGLAACLDSMNVRES